MSDQFSVKLDIVFSQGNTQSGYLTSASQMRSENEQEVTHIQRDV
jgi:hypothetical protein